MLWGKGEVECGKVVGNMRGADKQHKYVQQAARIWADARLLLGSFPRLTACTLPRPTGWRPKPICSPADSRVSRGSLLAGMTTWVSVFSGVLRGLRGGLARSLSSLPCLLHHTRSTQSVRSKFRARKSRIAHGSPPPKACFFHRGKACVQFTSTLVQQLPSMACTMTGAKTQPTRAICGELDREVAARPTFQYAPGELYRGMAFSRPGGLAATDCGGGSP